MIRVPVAVPMLIERGSIALVLLVPPVEALPPVDGGPYHATTARWQIDAAGCDQVDLVITWHATPGGRDHTIRLAWDLGDPDHRAPLAELTRQATRGAEVHVVMYETEYDRLDGAAAWLASTPTAVDRAVALAELDCRTLTRRDLPPG
ncbi:hypothetical protein [Saccharothrix deserti]|uniref:hypothetical protein n=1 Tax=Saccharothrix deserti TaxID=2593674 RepID=UPI00131DB07F|nr:hypothetical protein [Saccharothrix deserti]